MALSKIQKALILVIPVTVFNWIKLPMEWVHMNFESTITTKVVTALRSLDTKLNDWFNKE
jgi:hypothetical protein